MLALDQAGAGRSAARIARIHPSLEAFVEHAWVAPGRAGAGGGWRIVPDPCPHVIVARRARGVAVSLVGARTGWVDADTGRAWTVAVRLRPGSLPPLTGLPAADFTDRSVPLEEVFFDARDILEAAGEGPGAALTRLEALLRRHLADAPAPDWRVRGLDPGVDRVPGGPAAVSREMGVPPRTLRDAAAAHAGMSPRTLLRIRRLQRALLLALGGGARGRGPGGWSRVAGAAGYHDQSHLVRECRALLGETPGRFAQRSAAVGPPTPGSARRGAA